MGEAARTLEWLKFYAYVVGGIVLIWQVRIANRRATALERTAALGEKGNITERFKNAIEHLGNPSESIRMGGIYGLYHVVRESRGYADTVLKILCAHAKSVMAGPGYTEKEKPSSEIAAILDVLFPIIPDDENQKMLRYCLKKWTFPVGICKAQMSNLATCEICIMARK